MKTAAKDFKMTELGPIPKDWEVKRVDELAEVGRGRVISQVEIDKSSRHLYPVYSSQTLNNGEMGRIDTYDFDGEYVTWTTDGVNAGRVFYRTGRFNCTNVCGTLKIKEADAKFVAMSLGRQTQSYVATNLANPKLMNGVMKQVPFILPPLPEQRKIAAALSDVDEMIAALEKLIEKKRKIKTGVMQRLLTGKTRLPGFKGAWVEKRLGEMGDIMTGATPSTNVAAYWGGDIRWMSSGEVHLKYVKDVVGRITRQGFDSASTCMLPAKTVLIALAGQGKTRGTVAISLIPLCTNQSIAGIVPSSMFNSDFLYHCLDARYEDLRMISSGDGSRGGLSKQILSDYVVNIPPTLAEQKAIAKVLGDMDEEIAALEAELAKTRQLKQGMMQELLTGKTRLV